MKNILLFVDDEPGILEGLEMMLFKQRHRWQLHFATSGVEALGLIDQRGFEVVVSDMRMPVMNGIQFLSQVKEKSPDTVRMMLTGNADFATAMAAVNDGNVFRFISKPCESQLLIGMLEAGIEQYRLITAERELLTKTLSGSIKLLTEILSMTDTRTFSKALWLRDMVRTVADRLELRKTWDIALAAMLSPIGCITLPTEILGKMRHHQELAREEAEMVARVPEIGYNLLCHIPRLESVARIVLYQNKCFDGSGIPEDQVEGEGIPLGARIIKILSDLYQLSATQHCVSQILKEMKERQGWYDPRLLVKIAPLFSPPQNGPAEGVESISIPLSGLRIGQKLLSDIETTDGQLVAAAGVRISPSFLERINNFTKIIRMKEPVLIEKT